MKSGYIATEIDPVGIAVHGWASGWDGARIAQCFNNMPELIGTLISNAGCVRNVEAIMRGDRAVMAKLAMESDDPLDNVLGLLGMAADGRI